MNILSTSITTFNLEAWSLQTTNVINNYKLIYFDSSSTIIDFTIDGINFNTNSLVKDVTVCQFLGKITNNLVIKKINSDSITKFGTGGTTA